MYLTLGVNGGTRKSKSMEIKAVKSCLLTFSKSTWITLYNFVCVGANLFQFSFHYDVFGSGKCRMRYPESNVQMKNMCVSAGISILLSSPLWTPAPKFWPKAEIVLRFRSFLRCFGHFAAARPAFVMKQRRNLKQWQNDDKIIQRLIFPNFFWTAVSI